MKIPTEESVVRMMKTDNEVILQVYIFIILFCIFKVNRKECLDKILTIHNVECDAYDLIKDIKNFPLPEIYYVEKANENTNGIIMMEDLSEECTVMGSLRSVTAELCLEVARHFADFQVYIQSLKGDEWRGKFQQSINTRGDLIPYHRKCLHLAQEYNNGGYFN